MAITSPDGLLSPDGSDPYNLTVDLAAMQASTQAALTNRRTRQGHTGLRMDASGLQDGTLWFDTDDGVLYLWTGSAWVAVAPTTSVEEIHTYVFSQTVSPTADWKAVTFTLPESLNADRGLQGSLLADATGSTSAMVVGTLARHTGIISQVTFRFASIPRNMGTSTNVLFVVSGYPA